MTPLVKICGVRRLEDALFAVELGAAAIGFVFWPGSPRFVDPYRARAIAAALPPCVAPIGVFVDQPPDYVSGVAALLSLAAVQLHGHEAPESYAQSMHRVIKAVPVGAEFDPQVIDGIPPVSRTKRKTFETPAPSMLIHPWSCLRRYGAPRMSIHRIALPMAFPSLSTATVPSPCVDAQTAITFEAET